SEACSNSLQDPECESRLQATFAAFEPDVQVILEEIVDAAPDATVLFLTAYNPFSLGLGTELEAATDAALAEFNAIAGDVADELGVLVGDGFGPMRRTAGATTHMLDASPDIHPVPIGYDLLAGALLDAL
ncbi:MAG: SGNH/GDSL hydrolase family protein, partial [Acidimicrobiia bacterium]|nr:SGNH/GDSL hydrolase family protein [Acidimicrobiia bacterium]